MSEYNNEKISELEKARVRKKTPATPGARRTMAESTLNPTPK